MGLGEQREAYLVFWQAWPSFSFLKDKMTCLHVDFALISLFFTFILPAQSCLQCPHYLSYRRDFQLL